MNDLKFEIAQMFFIQSDYNTNFNYYIDRNITNFIINNFELPSEKTKARECCAADNNTDSYLYRDILNLNTDIYKKAQNCENNIPIIACSTQNSSLPVILTRFPCASAIIESNIKNAAYIIAEYFTEELRALGFNMLFNFENSERMCIFCDKYLDFLYDINRSFTDNEFLLSYNYFDCGKETYKPVPDFICISDILYENFQASLIPENIFKKSIKKDSIIINNIMHNHKLNSAYSQNDILLGSIRSGYNMFIIKDCDDINEYIKYICSAAKEDPVIKNKIHKSYLKIMNAKQKIKFPKNNNLDVIKSKAHISLKKEISRASVRKTCGGVDLSKALMNKCAVIAPYSTPNNFINQINPFYVDFAFYFADKFKLQPYHYLYNFNKSYIKSLVHSIEDYEYVVFAMNNSNLYNNQLDLLEQLFHNNKKIIIVSLGIKDEINDIKSVENKSNSYSYSHYLIHEYTPDSIEALYEKFCDELQSDETL